VAATDGLQELFPVFPKQSKIFLQRVRVDRDVQHDRELLRCLDLRNLKAMSSPRLKVVAAQAAVTRMLPGSLNWSKTYWQSRKVEITALVKRGLEWFRFKEMICNNLREKSWQRLRGKQGVRMGVAYAV
jgi:hypothetical protein